MQYGMLTAVAMACSVITSQASLTYVNPETGGNGEPSLNTIMTTVYGAADYTRVDDSSDQIWSLTSPTGTASLDAIYAGNSQALYTTDLSGNPSGINPIISVMLEVVILLLGLLRARLRLMSTHSCSWTKALLPAVFFGLLTRASILMWFTITWSLF